VSITSLIVTSSHNPSPGISELICRTSVPSLRAHTTVRKGFTYVEERRASGDRRGSVYLNTDGTSRERVLVLRIPKLPFVPDFIDHLNNVHVSATLSMKQSTEPYRVMEEKHGIYLKGGSGFRVSTRAHDRNRNNSYRSETTSFH